MNDLNKIITEYAISSMKNRLLTIRALTTYRMTVGEVAQVRAHTEALERFFDMLSSLVDSTEKVSEKVEG